MLGGFKGPSYLPSNTKTGPIPTAWKKFNNEILQTYRYRADPLADETIQELYSKNKPQVVHEFLIQQHFNFSLSNQTDPVLKHYVDKITVPSWADKAVLVKAEETYDRFAIVVNALLHWYSLPLSYVCEHGAIVLLETGELTDLTKPRILKTARLIRSVLSHKAFAPEGKGIVNIAKVRLVHALVRHSILNPKVSLTYPFDPSVRGLPINQEDMVGTLLTFSVAIIDGLKRLGVNFTTEEEESYMHLWNVTGSMMGVQEELLPKNLEEAYGTARAIINHQYIEPNDYSKALTQALLKYLREITPGKLGDNFHSTMMRFCIGDEMANDLEVPIADLTKYLIPGIKRGLSYLDHLHCSSEKLKQLSFLQLQFIRFLVHFFAQGNTLDYDEGKLKNEAHN